MSTGGRGSGDIVGGRGSLGAGGARRGLETSDQGGRFERKRERAVVYGPATRLQERKRSRSLWSLANSWPVSAAALDRQARDRLSQERRSLSPTSRCEHPRRGRLLSVNSRCGERSFSRACVPTSPSNSSSPSVKSKVNPSRAHRGCREIERRYIRKVHKLGNSSLFSYETNLNVAAFDARSGDRATFLERNSSRYA